MRFASCWLFWAALLVLTALAGCGGNSSVTTCKGSDGSYSAAACAATGGSTSTVTLDTPTGSNTTEVIVDAGPASFSMGTANVPFVTVTVCPPNSGPASASACVTIDHIFLDTGSYGLRLLKSGVARLSLPALTLAANAQFNTPGGTAVECYPFVLGGVWGPLAQADVHIAGETATAIPIQVIDDGANPALTPPADCNSAAGGSLFSNAASLQANGILGIGMIPYDCGLTCTSPLNYAGFHIQYYVCPDSVTANCQAAAVAAEQQVQNPLAHFVPDDGNPENPGLADNNGSIISLPALSPVGAGVAKGKARVWYRYPQQQPDRARRQNDLCRRQSSQSQLSLFHDDPGPNELSGQLHRQRLKRLFLRRRRHFPNVRGFFRECRHERLVLSCGQHTGGAQRNIDGFADSIQHGTGELFHRQRRHAVQHLQYRLQ